MSTHGAILRLLIPFTAVLAGCRPQVATRSPEPPTVVVTKPAVEAAARTQTYTGTVRPRYETDHGFRVGGKLVARKVEVGDHVTVGQVLAALDETDLAISVRAAENDVKAATALALDARQELDRTRQLRATNATSASECDLRTANYDSANEQLRKAERMLELAKNRLGYCTLRADADGLVTGVSAEVGQVVAEGQPVVKIARQGHREAVVAVPEHKLADVKAMHAQVSLWAKPADSVPTTLRELTPSADPSTRTYQAKFPLPDDYLAELGMTVTVQLCPSPGAVKLAVPLSAVAQRSNQPGVWVVEPKSRKLSFTAVTVAEYRQDLAVLSSGLTGNEWVVRAGVQKLDAGLAVRVREVTR
jgi:multidrug efflux system membrane fusion protein